MKEQQLINPDFNIDVKLPKELELLFTFDQVQENFKKLCLDKGWKYCLIRKERKSYDVYFSIFISKKVHESIEDWKSEAIEIYEHGNSQFEMLYNLFISATKKIIIEETKIDYVETTREEKKKGPMTDFLSCTLWDYLKHDTK